MISARLMILLVVAVALTAVVATATTLGVGKGSLLVWNARVSAPPAPSHLEGEFHHSTPTIVLTWEPVARAEYYWVYRQEDGGSVTRLADTSQESYTDTDIEEGVQYRYFVTSVGADGLESRPSGRVTVLAVEPTPTPKPTPTATPEEQGDSEATPTPVAQATDEPAVDDPLEIQARWLGADWIDDNANPAYQIVTSTCQAEEDGSHWAVTCLGELRGCQGPVCWRTFRACVFGQPSIRDWC